MLSVFWTHSQESVRNVYKKAFALGRFQSYAIPAKQALPHPRGFSPRPILVESFFFSTGSLMCTTFSTAFPQWMEASKNNPQKYDRIVIACICVVLQLIRICDTVIFPFEFTLNAHFQMVQRFVFVRSMTVLFQCSGFKSLWAGSCHRLQMSGWFSLRQIKNALCHKRPLTSLQLSAVSFACQIYKGGH